MTDGAADTGPATGDGVIARKTVPLRPAAPRRARSRAGDPAPPPPGIPVAAPVELIEHVTLLSEVVVAGSDRVLDEVRALVDTLAALERSVRSLEARLGNLERSVGTAGGRALADEVVARLQAAFRVVGDTDRRYRSGNSG